MGATGSCEDGNGKMVTVFSTAKMRWRWKRLTVAVTTTAKSRENVIAKATDNNATNRLQRNSLDEVAGRNKQEEAPHFRMFNCNGEGTCRSQCSLKMARGRIGMLKFLHNERGFKLLVSALLP